MKKFLLVAGLFAAAVGSWSFYPKAAEPTGYMMIVSNVSNGFNAQAAIVVVGPDGAQQSKEVEFSRGSAKQLANNSTEVHKAALATVNEYARKGWRMVSATPTQITGTGNTIFYQTVYMLEQR